METTPANDNRVIKTYIQDDPTLNKLHELKFALIKKGRITDEELPVNIF